MKRTLNLRVKKNIYIYVYASIASGTRCGETRASHRFLELIPYDSTNNEPSSSYFEKKEKKEEEEKMNVNH